MVNLGILFKRAAKVQSNPVSPSGMELYVGQPDCYVTLAGARRIIPTWIARV